VRGGELESHRVLLTGLLAGSEGGGGENGATFRHTIKGSPMDEARRKRYRKREKR